MFGILENGKLKRFNIGDVVDLRYPGSCAEHASYLIVDNDHGYFIVPSDENNIGYFRDPFFQHEQNIIIQKGYYEESD